ncbi:MAG TPA: hypothetical protein VGC41_09455 [Kofleriaceae bacterium]
MASWRDLEAQFPSTSVAEVPGVATHVMRLALGFSVDRTVTRDRMLEVVRNADNWHTPRRLGDENAWRGMMALIAGYLGDWDLVAQVTGGGALGTRVLQKKKLGSDTRAFARHLATACARKLPAEHVAVAMAEQRERFVAGTCAPDGRTAVLATAIFLRELAVVEDVVAATGSWLDGTLAIEAAAPAAKAVADGEDARVKIFERYAAELEDGPIDAAVRAVHEPEEWGRHLHRAWELDDLAIQAFVARRPLWPDWDRTIDPAVALWLGAEPWELTRERLADLKRGTHRGIVALGLAVGDPRAAKPMAWKPGKFFKDDAKKLYAYLASALANHALESDVVPAWHDFLARRSPMTTPIVEKEELHWKTLLAIQAAITEQIGKRAPAQVGGELRRAITGSF